MENHGFISLAEDRDKCRNCRDTEVNVRFCKSGLVKDLFASRYGLGLTEFFS